MSVIETSLLLALAFVVGIVAALLGIGGAIIIVPILVYFLGWPEKLSQGTTLAMLLPPVSVLAVWQYYKARALRVGPAVIMAVFVLTGISLGGRLAQFVPAAGLTKVFGAFAVFLALRMILQRDKAKRPSEESVK